MTGLCTAGYYCPNGSVSAEDIDCPVGHYCPLGSSTPQPCQNGTFSDNIRLTAQVSAVRSCMNLCTPEVDYRRIFRIVHKYCGFYP